MSSGALPKQKSSQSSSGQISINIPMVQNSRSELFELEPKPKLCCIPENYGYTLSDLKKTQSVNADSTTDRPEKSCSVLFVGSKDNMHSNWMMM